MTIPEKIYQFNSGKKGLAVLIDPDRYNPEKLKTVAKLSSKNQVDFFLVGGSLTFSSINETISELKKWASLPIIIFPGNVMQVSPLADGILFISLISGRNPEFLIGQHVVAAPEIKKSGLEVFPTAYILIENGKRTSVEYMSNTIPIPASKPEIAVATAMAGEMLGFKLTYLEAGSGASETVGLSLINQVKKNISTPLMVGGGIRSAGQLTDIYEAGADIIVAGNAIEEDPELIIELGAKKSKFQD